MTPEFDFDRHVSLSRIFTPSAPINRRELFRGRIDQVLEITTAINQPGRHVVLYGERGVGKTSLANLLTDFIGSSVGGDEVQPAVRVNCTTQDDFRSMWAKVFRELRMTDAVEWAGDPLAQPDPDDIRWQLAQLPVPRIIVFDEFDRMEDDEALSLMADTLKSLSDHVTDTKVVLVGVADSIDQLIGEHESVQRAVEEVAMPRMTEAEIVDIIDQGLAAAEMTIDRPARTRIARISEGLPTYAHLLTLHAAQNAVQSNVLNVRPTDVDYAIGQAVDRHSLIKEYQLAVQSPRKDNLFSRVLASCALAEKNRLGYFTAGSVREPMSRIMGRPYEIAAFAPHLNAFTEVDRGSVLRKEGPKRRYVYRFRNPLLQPFAILAAISDGSIPEDYQNELFG